MKPPAGAGRKRATSSLRVLITNAFLRDWSGSELFVRDLATELINRGHKPVVYSPRIGELADVLRQKSIPVVQDLDSTTIKPDLIHGQHHLETMTALGHFPGTPAIFLCHGWLPWEEIPPLHPRIMRYVTVSDAVRDRLIYECGIRETKITTILNAADLERFRPRPALPRIPRRALVFNSQINETNVLGIFREACARHGMSLEVMGYASGTPSIEPEARLGEYDIVFAHGRSALEALAVGTAVICCGLEGAGPMVSMQNLQVLRRNNLAIRVHSKALTSDGLSAEIARYDPVEASRVCAEVRATAGLDGMVDEMLSIYAGALSAWGKSREPSAADEGRAYSVYLKGISDALDEARAGNRSAQARAMNLQAELERVHGTVTWRVRQAAVRMPFVRAPLLGLRRLLRRAGSGQGGR